MALLLMGYPCGGLCVADYIRRISKVQGQGRGTVAWLIEFAACVSNAVKIQPMSDKRHAKLP
ncbi:hypothetical protein [Shewanella sp.]|uniref:hypothetical protein n=1 Tax=Shewanella sp. TaxID=50422 RepID=UPI003568C7D4